METWTKTSIPGIFKRETEGGIRYKVWWRDAGHRQRTKTFRRWTDARSFAGTVIHRRSTGNLPDLERGRMTLADLFEEVHAKRHYAPATLEVHDVVLGKVEPLADKELRQIDRAAVGAVLESISKPSMRDKARRVMHAMFAYAVAEGYITANPVQSPNVSKTRADKIARGKGGTEPERHYLTEDELQRLLDEMPERWRAMTMLMARMGLRPGEAVAVAVDRFLPATEVPERRPARLRIDTSMSGFTKTGEARELVLPEVVAEALADHVERFCKEDPTAPMFTRENGRPIASRNAYGAWRRNVFTPAAKRANVNGGLSPNDLRHSAASFAIHQGANVYAVQKMLGHARPSITLDVYGEMWDSSQEELAVRLDEAIRKSASKG